MPPVGTGGEGTIIDSPWPVSLSLLLFLCPYHRMPEPAYSLPTSIPSFPPDLISFQLHAPSHQRHDISNQLTKPTDYSLLSIPFHSVSHQSISALSYHNVLFLLLLARPPLHVPRRPRGAPGQPALQRQQGIRRPSKPCNLTQHHDHTHDHRSSPYSGRHRGPYHDRQDSALVGRRPTLHGHHAQGDPPGPCSTRLPVQREECRRCRC